MGYSGACRRQELINIELDDIEYKSQSPELSNPENTNVSQQNLPGISVNAGVNSTVTITIYNNYNTSS
ncbi:hypothetical protein PPYR_13572 [Photinus pyralis]|uniref:Uncharacterized protein n=1 Tax=Photinus pyralis TaxID=7054 RepID=A0A5N4A9F3_PHOPY|nr:hypothetical protein PPYR_13572 [Photinus pyralis]